jgi:hypothetical protein
MGTVVLTPGVKRGRGVTLTTHPHLVPRSWMSRSYTSSPSCASRGVPWDCFTFLPNQQHVTAISRAGGEEGPLALAGTRTPHPDQINFKMTNLLDVIHRLFLIKTIHNLTTSVLQR